MKLDARGGHNRKTVNENFFKAWNAKMAYILGLIYADGAIEDVRKSSRACYIQITSKDKVYLEKIKKTLRSNHNIYTRKPHSSSIKGKIIQSKKHYCLRIGNRILYSDLIKIGLTPRKSLIMKLPKIPKQYLGFFLRGYFDGDGSVVIYKSKKYLSTQLVLVFTSGSIIFLTQLAEVIKKRFRYASKKVYQSKGAYMLKYSKQQGLQLLSFIYTDLNDAPFLARKYKIFKKFSLTARKWVQFPPRPQG